MTAIIPGTGATIESDSAEQQLLDIITLIKGWEKVPSKNPSNASTINCSLAYGSGLANISFQIPATPSIDGAGNQVMNVLSYLINTGFTPGTGGLFKSTSPEAYFAEVLSYLEITEGISNKNPNQNNYVSSTFDSDNRFFTGTVTLPFTFELGEGFVKIRASEYLLD
jgi:hypothetical protein